MIRFGVTTLGYTALLLMFSAPAIFMARRRSSPDTTRRFLIAAVACGLACAILAAGSRRLEAQCEAEGNTQCVDYGASGLLLIIIVAFLCTALVRTYLLVRD